MLPLTRAQIEYRAYLRRHFPASLAEVAREAPRWPECGHVEPDDGIVLQPAHLGRRNPAIRSMSSSERDFFAVALCWVVLLDEAVWSWAPREYPRFRELTWFPKLHGDCQRECGLHLHPMKALAIVGGRSGDWMGTRLTRISLLAWTAAAVEDIVLRLDEIHGLPFLPEVFRRGLLEVGVPTPGRGIPTRDPLGPDAITDWRMPRISQRELTRRHMGHQLMHLRGRAREAGHLVE